VQSLCCARVVAAARISTSGFAGGKEGRRLFMNYSLSVVGSCAPLDQGHGDVHLSVTPGALTAASRRHTRVRYPCDSGACGPNVDRASSSRGVRTSRCAVCTLPTLASLWGPNKAPGSHGMRFVEGERGELAPACWCAAADSG
jgi:hypothetical protein